MLDATTEFIESNRHSIKNAAKLISLISSNDNNTNLLQLDKEMVRDLIEIIEKFSEINRDKRSGLMVRSFGSTADINKEQEQWRLEFGAILGATVLAMAFTNKLDNEIILESAIHIAVIPDASSLILRRALTGRLNLWDPRDPLKDIPDVLQRFPLKDYCIMNLQRAALTLVKYVQSASKIRIVYANADGITGLKPNIGLAGDIISIEGRFSANKSSDIQIGFVRSDGKFRIGEIMNWSANKIEVSVPEDIDEGPVGFFIDKNGAFGFGGAPMAAIDFGSLMTECLGPSTAGIGDKFARIPPLEFFEIRQTIPVLAKDENMFYASPVLDSLSFTLSSQDDPNPVILKGHRFQPSDKVEVGGVLCPTTFVDPTRLDFHILDVPSGKRFVRVRRGVRKSNKLEMNVRVTIQTNQGRRVKPSSWVSLSGSGFAKDEVYAMLRNGSKSDRLYDNIHSLNTMHIFVVRPNPPPARDKKGEKVLVDIFDRFGVVGTIEFILDTYRIAVFGDSIMWGQGLTESTKFTSLVADYLQTKFGTTIGVYDEDRLAHSGATIMASNSSDDPIPDVSNPPPKGNFEGEHPKSFPSITNQVAAWTQSSQISDEAREVDLVILNGGINDVNVRTILNPFESDINLVNKTVGACGNGMAQLLQDLLTTFPNAQVIVTGYCPIVSEETDLLPLFLLAMGLGVLAGLGAAIYFLGSTGPIPSLIGGALGASTAAWVKSRLVTRAALFASTANNSLSMSVSTMGPRVKFVTPQFNSANSIFAPDSLLFGVNVGLGTLNPVDPIAPMRLQLKDCSDDIICKIASIGHPNERGAKAYFEAIRSVL